MASATEQISGLDLKLLRMAREVRQMELARHYGTSRQRITRLEAERRPTLAAVQRYMAALDAAASGR